MTPFFCDCHAACYGKNGATPSGRYRRVARESACDSRATFDATAIAMMTVALENPLAAAEHA